jgi:nicotinate phosphoribosyltransferase
MDDASNSALRTDRYEFTMLNAALLDGTAARKAVFEVFARFLPEGRSFGVVAGIERVVDAILSFRFTDDQVRWLVDEGVVDKQFRDTLQDFSFTGSVFGYGEGELYLANSPILRIEATFGEGVILETLVLSILNHDTAVASTAARMAIAAQGRRLIEMGSRRTHEESAVHAARAAYLYGVPTAGTAAHAWVLAHDSEFDAFVAQIEAQGVGTTLLVDTFDTNEGIVAAVKAANHFGAAGPGAVRIDSGDLLVGSIAGRELLNSLGATDTRIVATGDLDEERIADLVGAGAPVDSFGVGTRLVTGANCPSPGFVYKLVAIESRDGTMNAVAKRSLEKQDSGGTTYVRRLSVLEAKGAGLAVAETPATVEVIFKSEPDDSLHPSWAHVQRPLVVNGARGETKAELVDLRARTLERLTSPSGLVQRPL